MGRGLAASGPDRTGRVGLGPAGGPGLLGPTSRFIDVPARRFPASARRIGGRASQTSSNRGDRYDAPNRVGLVRTSAVENQ